jgi:hypothetical protein
MALAAGGLVFSCTGFFSTSLAPWAARDSAALIPPVNAGNVDDLIAGAENDPDMSLELLKKIRDAASGAGGEEAAGLQAAALQAAVNASGLGATLLNNVDNITGAIENPEGAAKDFSKILNEMPNLEQSGEILTEVLPDPGTPEFDAFVEKASPDDLTTAAVALLAAEAKGKDESFIDNFDPSAAETGSTKLAVAMAEAALKKYDDSDSGGMFKDLLGGLNLIPKEA